MWYEVWGQVTGGSVGDRIGELEQQATKVERRLTEVVQELVRLNADTVDEVDLRKALSLFDPVWSMLFPAEQARVIHLLIESIDFNGKTGKLGIEFAPSGIQALAGEIDSVKEVSA